MKHENKVEEKEIPIKNYIILGIIFLLGIIIALYFCDWYKVYDNYQRQTPIIRGTLSEITTAEVEHYVLENPTATFYMCTADESICRNFEKDFKKYVEKESLTDKIIYVNLTDTDVNSFVTEFNNKYNYKIKLTNNYPALVTFDDGHITGLVQGNKDKKLTVSKAKQFIEMNKIGE